MTNNTMHAEDWIQDLELRGRTKGTLRSYKSSVRGFRELTNDKDWTRIDDTDLRNYLAALRKKNLAMKTIKLHFSAIASLFDYLHYNKHRPDNPVPPFRSRYLDRTSANVTSTQERRRLLTLDEAQQLVRGTMDIRARTLLAVLFKTGIRREEASNIDVEDIDWKRCSITLKPHAKRTNTVVYFDDETGRLLKRWLSLRQARGAGPTGPLFINQRGTRMGRNGVYNIVTQTAQAHGLHDPKGPMRERFSPHCCRHWFTTHLRRAGMPDNMIAELRGDADARTIDVYTHIDHDELRDTYLAKIPRLNI